MKNVHIDIDILLEDGVADWVASLDDLRTELAAYFSIRFNGGILVSQDRLTDIIDDVMNDYEDSSNSETVLTDRDYDELSDMMKGLLNQFLSNGENIVINNNEQDGEVEKESDVVVFEEVVMEDGTSQDLSDNEDDGLDDLGAMFGFD